MTRFTHRIALLSTAALLGYTTSVTAAETAAEEGPERDYLPAEIVVTGAVGEYAVEDGSTGTKTPTPLIDVPQTVTFITDDQLEDQSIRQLGEALRYVPGVSLETGEGHRDEIFIRGQETTADFYLDGLRDDAQYYRPLYNVARVEVLKGANALIFGRGGGGGVVNRVSKTADLGEAFGEFDASADTFGAFALLGDVNAPLSDSAALRVNATYEEFDSHRDFYEGRFIGISPTLTARLGPDTTLTATYSYDDDSRVVDRGIPSLAGVPLMGFEDTFFGDPDFNRTDAEVHILRSRIEHAFSDQLSVNASVQYADYDKIYQNIVPGGTDGTTVSLSGYQDAQTRENLIGQANLVWQVETAGVENTFLFGVEAMDQQSTNQRSNVQFAGTNTTPLADVITVPAFSLGPLGRDRDSSLSTFSAYVQDQLSFGIVEIVAGLRYERFDLETVELLTGVPGSRVDEEVSPRAAIILKPQENLSFYASYAESFLPQSGDQFFLLTPTTEAFEPEKFTNYEIGAKWSVKPGLLATASIFRLDRDNTRATDPNNTGLTILTGASRTEGFELNVIGDITPNWHTNIGYTYLDGEITSQSTFGAAGQRLQQLPKHQISAWNRFDVTEAFGLGFGVIYQDEQFASFSNNVTLPDYWRFDAAAYYTVNDRISLQVNIENLFDETYFPSAHGDNNIQPAEPFSARFGVRVKI
ncbi:TonB-dependent receptor [Erythrobacter litoralis]|uniref:Putative TonB-dependent receptor n=1 Tax=Erythrobacter litoralis (strain HTCC2594) TaxID=314225 RepID=Q2NDS2_ERYLH|nr:TonB-dependent siderophore receptor [Erythrobacter litoralis]ABC62169.1 putative TonB-dependent receptor [Erythrobacter litoralis HTCC2594]